MAFSLDRIANYVQIDEPNLISIHRSTKIIVPSDDSCLGHLCEAFICVGRENKTIRVYVALYDTRQKSNLVFVADPISPDKRGLVALVREAEIFLNDLGFNMEPVNLKFSPAVREVIMRDMKIMKPPKLVAEKQKPEQEFEDQEVDKKSLLHLSPEMGQAPHYNNNCNAEREFTITARLAEATAAVERLSSEMDELRHKASRELKKIKTERDTLKYELDAAKSAGHEATTALTTNSKNINKIKSMLEMERNTLQFELSSAQKELETLRCVLSETQIELTNENNTLRDVIEQLRGEQEIKTVTLSNELEDMRTEMTKNSEGSAKTIASLKSESDALRSELSSAREQVETLRCVLSEMQTELNNENSRLSEEVEQLQAERETATTTLSSELEALRSALKLANASIKKEQTKIVERGDSTATLSKEVEALRAALTITDESLRAERDKNESALQEMDALERNAAVELKSLKKKVDSLFTEKQVLERMAAEMKLKAKGEIERLQQVNQSQRRAAVKKVNALKEEIRQLAEARTAMTSPFGVALSQDGEKGGGAVALSREKALVPCDNISDIRDVPLNPFASIGFSDNVISFEPDKTLKGIPYCVPADVVEVYRSFNKINAAPTGKLVQKCDGFVCMVKDGAKRSVYVAWQMNDTDEVLVCRPDCIPEGRDSARHIVLEGIGYFERIGFLMDRLHLEGDLDRRQRQFDELSIFHRIVMECAA